MSIQSQLNQLLFFIYSKRSTETGDKYLLDRNLSQVNFWSAVHFSVMLVTALLQVFMIRRLFGSSNKTTDSKQTNFWVHFSIHLSYFSIVHCLIFFLILFIAHLNIFCMLSSFSWTIRCRFEFSYSGSSAILHSLTHAFFLAGGGGSFLLCVTV